MAMLAVTLVVLASCSDRPDTAPAQRRSETPTPSPLPGPAVSVIDENGLAAEIERHRGKVVLVDFWATWCPECLRLMPHTVELKKSLGDRLAVIFVSLDSPDDDLDAVRKVLTRNGVTFDSYISRHGTGPKSAEVFDIQSAALPNIRIYDREGTLRKTFSAGRMPPEPFEAEDIEKTVRELAAEQ
jgi:thiol-disulfide isomerase/thioredoxin